MIAWNEVEVYRQKHGGGLPPQSIEQACMDLVREHHLAEGTLTEKQLAEAIRQAIASGDFVKYLAGDGRQQVVYIPGRGMAELQTKYNELIYAVEKAYPGETRHETALRYIREREAVVHGPVEEGR